MPAFVVKVVSQCVAEILGGLDRVFQGVWGGDLSDDVEEFFLVVAAGLDAGS